MGRKIAESLTVARKIGRVQRSAEADVYWDSLYCDLVGDETGGLVGAITDRCEAQVLRLSLLYALLDGSKVIELPHLIAAEAVWRYCADSVAYIFGDSVGDPEADKLLAAIRDAGRDGLDGSQQQSVFGRHIRGVRLAAIRALLEKRGQIVTEVHQTDGRDRLVSFATKAKKATKGVPRSHSAQHDQYPPEGRPIPNELS